jgi:hypothetical protein
LGERLDHSSEDCGTAGPVRRRIELQQHKSLLEEDGMLRERLVYQVVKENDGGSIRLVRRAPERQWQNVRWACPQVIPFGGEHYVILGHGFEHYRKTRAECGTQRLHEWRFKTEGSGERQRTEGPGLDKSRHQFRAGTPKTVERLPGVSHEGHIYLGVARQYDELEIKIVGVEDLIDDEVSCG